MRERKRMEPYSTEDGERNLEHASWRLLAALEAGTLLLVLFALVAHAVRARACSLLQPVRVGALSGQRVLIIKGESALSQELAKQFLAEQCHVSLLTTSTDLLIQGVEVLCCDTGQREQVKQLAEGLRPPDVLVVCGTGKSSAGLDALSEAVHDQLNTNYHVLEEIVRKMSSSGRVVGVYPDVDPGSFAAPARALRSLVQTLQQQLAQRSGCRVVWVEARGEGCAELARRAVRVVARDGLPTSADVFREMGHKMYGMFSRITKIWT